MATSWRNEQGLGLVTDAGLKLASNKNVGKLAMFKNPDALCQYGVFTVDCCQRLWGADMQNMVDGYRLSHGGKDFGTPARVEEIVIFDSPADFDDKLIRHQLRGLKKITRKVEDEVDEQWNGYVEEYSKQLRSYL